MIESLHPNVDIYDNHYYHLNKKLLRIVGLWPYDSKKKITRSLWLVLIVIITIPHMIGIAVNHANIDELMEHFCIVSMMASVFLKLFTLVISEGKMTCVYKDIARNWSRIKDEEEIKILAEYSENGRILTIAYVGIVVFNVMLFISLPLVPEILNVIQPLSVPRPHIYIFHGEFLLENKDDHYMKIYVCDVMIIIATIAVGFAGDTMYMAGVEHCSALYSIVKYRLSTLSRHSDANDTSYQWLLDIIKLHQLAIRFTNNINDSYSLCFLCLALTNIIALPISCVLMITYVGDPTNFFRMGLLLASLMLHLFGLFWPGQKIVDHTTTLAADAYCNDWYETPRKTKILLRFFMLRCTHPPLLTAGGLIVMNLANYFTVVKTAASYVTVLLSFR